MGLKTRVASLNTRPASYGPAKADYVKGFHMYKLSQARLSMRSR